MNDDRDLPAGSLSLPPHAVDRILNRAASLDRDLADSLTVEEFRQAALEAGMSGRAIEEALAEYFELGESTPPASPARPALADVGYGSVGAILGASAALGSGLLIDLVLVGTLLTTIQLLHRHGDGRTFSRLMREASILWALYSVGWIAFGGSPWPHLFALPPLGLLVTGIIGFILGRSSSQAPQLPEAEDPSASLISPSLTREERDGGTKTAAT